jgi:hypothetical protein
MCRRWLIAAALFAGLFATGGCQTSGSWLDGGSFLSSLPFTGGAPMGQSEPELVYESQPVAE